MRDALSILDQAIASSTGRLTAEAVRQLVCAAPSGVLEEVMQAVSRSGSEEVLRLADKLISEGQNPTHFARQLVRFLRNAVVAKVAGKDSALLQISSDERARVARIADLFSEEDLARHLQIMLRTHGELELRRTGDHGAVQPDVGSGTFALHRLHAERSAAFHADDRAASRRRPRAARRAKLSGRNVVARASSADVPE